MKAKTPSTQTDVLKVSAAQHVQGEYSTGGQILGKLRATHIFGFGVVDQIFADEFVQRQDLAHMERGLHCACLPRLRSRNKERQGVKVR